MDKWGYYEIDIIKLHIFTSIQMSCRIDIYVVKWEKPFRPKFWWEFTGHKIKNTNIIAMAKTNSRFVISMHKNPLVPILMSCVEIFVVKWENKCLTSMLVVFANHKIKIKNRYCSNQKKLSRFMISIPENSLVPI